MAEFRDIAVGVDAGADDVLVLSPIIPGKAAGALVIAQALEVHQQSLHDIS